MLAGCGAGTEPRGAARAELVVLAAASLQDAFRPLGAAFGRESGVRVRFSFAGSQTLATQVREALPADVIASADPQLLEPLARDGLVSTPEPLAANRLVWVLTRGTAAGANGTDGLDARFLADEGLRLVLAAPAVPAGRYARNALLALGAVDLARARLVSLELDVRGVVAKVLLGEADAGLVYATDVPTELRDRVEIRELPPGIPSRADYAIAILLGTHDPERARAFVRYARGPAGLSRLRAHGFVAP